MFGVFIEKEKNHQSIVISGIARFLRSLGRIGVEFWMYTPRVHTSSIVAARERDTTTCSLRLFNNTDVLDFQLYAINLADTRQSSACNAQEDAALPAIE